jgi:hypothetical protein
MENLDSTPEEISLAKDLIRDVTLDITDPHYEPLASRLTSYLEFGYKPREIQAELELSDSQMTALQSHCPLDWWDSRANRRFKWLGRKRADKLSNSSDSDMAILQTLDPEWNPKVPLINLTVNNQYSDEERRKIDMLYKSEPKAFIEAEVKE